LANLSLLGGDEPPGEFGRTGVQGALGANQLHKEQAVLPEGGGVFPPLMPSTSASYGFGPGRSGIVNPAQLTVDQYVSPSVIDRKVKASKSQRGAYNSKKRRGLRRLWCSPLYQR